MRGSDVTVWLRQGNTQAVQSQREGQAVELQRGRSWEGHHWQLEGEEVPVLTTRARTNQCPLELGKIRCCFPVGQESPTSTWALETEFGQTANEEPHSWGKMVELVFLISDILACHSVSGVQNQAACHTWPTCSMPLTGWSFSMCCMTPTDSPVTHYRGDTQGFAFYCLLALNFLHLT